MRVVEPQAGDHRSHALEAQGRPLLRVVDVVDRRAEEVRELLRVALAPVDVGQRPPRLAVRAVRAPEPLVGLRRQRQVPERARRQASHLERQPPRHVRLRDPRRALLERHRARQVAARRPEIGQRPERPGEVRRVRVRVLVLDELREQGLGERRVADPRRHVDRLPDRLDRRAPQPRLQPQRLDERALVPGGSPDALVEVEEPRPGRVDRDGPPQRLGGSLELRIEVDRRVKELRALVEGGPRPEAQRREPVDRFAGAARPRPPAPRPSMHRAWMRACLSTSPCRS